MELMSFLCENKKFIDIKIYDKIRDFKNIFKENYKISKFLFLNGYNLTDLEYTQNFNNDIIKLLNKKVLELKDENNTCKA